MNELSATKLTTGTYKNIACLHAYENTEWKSHLLDKDGNGRDPLSVGIDILEKSGHPNRSLAKLKAAFACNASGQFDRLEIPKHITSYKKIREHCVECAGSCKEAKECSVYNCPFWAFRSGNPYSKKFGNTNGLKTQFQDQKHGETPSEIVKVEVLEATLPDKQLEAVE